MASSGSYDSTTSSYDSTEITQTGQVEDSLRSMSEKTTTIIIFLIQFCLLLASMITSVIILAVAQSLLEHKCGPRGTWSNELPVCQTPPFPGQCSTNGYGCRITQMNIYKERGGYKYGIFLMTLIFYIEIGILIAIVVLDIIFLSTIAIYDDIKIYLGSSLLMNGIAISGSVVIVILVYSIREFVHFISKKEDKINNQKNLEAWAWIMFGYIFCNLFGSICIFDKTNEH